MPKIIINGASEILESIETEYCFQNKWLVDTKGDVQFVQTIQSGTTDHNDIVLTVDRNKLVLNYNSKCTELQIPDKIEQTQQGGYIATFLRYLSPAIAGNSALKGIGGRNVSANEVFILGVHGYELPEGVLCHKLLGALLDKGMPKINNENNGAVSDGKSVISRLVAEINKEMRKICFDSMPDVRYKEMTFLLIWYLFFYSKQKYRDEISDLWLGISKVLKKYYNDICCEFAKLRPKYLLKKEQWQMEAESGLNKRMDNIYDRIAYCFSYIKGARGEIVKEYESEENIKIIGLDAPKDCPIDFPFFFKLLKKIDTIAIWISIVVGLVVGITGDGIILGLVTAMALFLLAHFLTCWFIHLKISREYQTLTKAYDRSSRDKIVDGLLTREFKSILRIIAGTLSKREKYLQDLVEIRNQTQVADIKYPWITVLNTEIINEIDLDDIGLPEDCLGKSCEWGPDDGDQILKALYEPIKGKIRELAGSLDQNIIGGMGNDQLEEECFVAICHNPITKKSEITGIILDKWAANSLKYLLERGALERTSDPLLGIWSLGHAK